MKRSVIVSALILWGCGGAATVIPVNTVKRVQLNNSLAQCAFTLLQETTPQRAKVHMLVAVGEQLARNGNAGDADIVLSSAYDSTLSIEHVVPREEAMTKLAIAFVRNGNAKRAMAAVQQVPTSALRVEALIAIATAYGEREQGNETSDVLKQALDELDGVTNPKAQAKLLWQIGQLYRRGGSERGERHVMEKIADVMQSNSETMALRFSVEVPGRLATLGVPTKARALAQAFNHPTHRERALDDIHLIDAVGNPTQIAQLSKPYLKVKAWLAHHRADKAASIAGSVYDDGNRARAHILVADAYDKSGDVEKSAAFKAQAKTCCISDRTGAYKRAKVLVATSATALAKGRRAWAEQPLNDALNTALQISNAADRVDILLTISQLYVSGGGDKGAAMALGLAVEATSLVTHQLKRSQLVRRLLDAMFLSPMIRLADLKRVETLVSGLSSPSIQARLQLKWVDLALKVRQPNDALKAVKSVANIHDKALFLAKLSSQLTVVSGDLNTWCSSSQR